MMIQCAECLKIQDGDYIEHDEIDGALICEYCLADIWGELEPLDKQETLD